MNRLCPLLFTAVALLLDGAVLHAASSKAKPAAPPVQVLGVLGRAQFSRNGGEFAPLAPGAQLQAGDIVRTATGSALDLQFNPAPVNVRLTAETVLVLERLPGVQAPSTGSGQAPSTGSGQASTDSGQAPSTGSGQVSTDSGRGPGGLEVGLALRSGEILTQSKPLPASARFEIKTTIGIAQVLGGVTRIQARGYLVVTEGKMLFAHVVAGKEPAAHALSAPPPCYFTPSTGIQPAPRDLVQEVKSQWKAKLPKP
ncbi:MAG TPA: hypothetical protein VNH84_02970 [Candidatus Saccharimonadales bacterium]|nr:hypothetical protein [Candidatus Saccharimonadales bacterium]